MRFETFQEFHPTCIPSTDHVGRFGILVVFVCVLCVHNMCTLLIFVHLSLYKLYINTFLFLYWFAVYILDIFICCIYFAKLPIWPGWMCSLDLSMPMSLAGSHPNGSRQPAILFVSILYMILVSSSTPLCPQGSSICKPRRDQGL